MILKEKENLRGVTVEELRTALEEEERRHVRTLADFDNYRKRMERNSEAQFVRAKREILFDLLAFLDYFDQAREQIEDPATLQGLGIIRRQFDLFMSKQGVTQVTCLGQAFDPEEHEGVGYVDNDQYQEGCVATEISPGYWLDGLLLRPAKVMVVKPSG